MRSFSERKIEEWVTLTKGQPLRGKTNQHRIIIQKEPEMVYHVLTYFDNYKYWIPTEEMIVEKITPGPLHIGSVLHFKLKFRIEPEWDTEVVLLERPSRIVYRFLNGIFEGGMECWELNKKDQGTEVTHTLYYQIKKWIHKIGWTLLGGEKKHNELTETALKRLKFMVEGISS